ncbi:DUF418 domain-containing protein [Streptomyces sp. NPDC002643]
MPKDTGEQAPPCPTTALPKHSHPRPPAAPTPHPTAAPTSAAPSTPRLIGVDLARGLAVFGMYAAHVGPDPSEGGTVGFLMELSHGRASALFAFLAGFSIVLITGRSAPKTGRAGRQAVAKVVIRAVVLLAAGTALTLTGTPVEVILAFYGLFFLLVLPLYRLSARPLAIIAALGTLVLPQILYVVTRLLHDTEPGGIWAWPEDADGLVSLLFTGGYPALTWVPFVVAGMAVARLDLTATAVRVRLALTGVALAVLGYGGSWLALRLVPGALAKVGESGVDGDGAAASAWWSDTWGWPSGESPYALLVASPHSETTLSIVGNTGVALTILVGCLAAVDAFPRLPRLARPVVAVGSMSLTAYVLHVLGIHALGIEELPGSPVHVLVGFLLVVSVFATLWSRYVRRGPLEWLLGKATKPAERVR